MAGWYCPWESRRMSMLVQATAREGLRVVALVQVDSAAWWSPFSRYRFPKLYRQSGYTYKR